MVSITRVMTSSDTLLGTFFPISPFEIKLICFSPPVKTEVN